MTRLSQAEGARFLAMKETDFLDLMTGSRTYQTQEGHSKALRFPPMAYRSLHDWHFELDDLRRAWQEMNT